MEGEIGVLGGEGSSGGENGGSIGDSGENWDVIREEGVHV